MTERPPESTPPPEAKDLPPPFLGMPGTEGVPDGTAIYNNPVQNMMLGVTAGLAGAVMLWSGLTSANVLGVAIGAGFSGLGYMGLRRFTRRGPQIVLDPDGIRFAMLDDLVLPWDKIARVELVARGLLGFSGNARVVEMVVHVHDYRGLCAPLSPGDRVRLFFKGLKFRCIAINMRNMLFDRPALEMVLARYDRGGNWRHVPLEPASPEAAAPGPDNSGQEESGQEESGREETAPAAGRRQADEAEESVVRRLPTRRTAGRKASAERPAPKRPRRTAAPVPAPGTDGDSDAAAARPRRVRRTRPETDPDA